MAAVDRYAAGRWVEEPENQARERRFPAAGFSDHRHMLTRTDLEVTLLENVPIWLVGEGNVAELNGAGERRSRYCTRNIPSIRCLIQDIDDSFTRRDSLREPARVLGEVLQRLECISEIREKNNQAARRQFSIQRQPRPKPHYDRDRHCDLQVKCPAQPGPQAASLHPVGKTPLGLGEETGLER